MKVCRSTSEKGTKRQTISQTSIIFSADVCGNELLTLMNRVVRTSREVRLTVTMASKK